MAFETRMLGEKELHFLVVAACDDDGLHTGLAEGIDKFKRAGEHRVDDFILEFVEHPVHVGPHLGFREICRQDVVEGSALDIICESRGGEMVRFAHFIPETCVERLAVDEHAVEVKQSCLVFHKFLSDFRFGCKVSNNPLNKSN